MSYVADPNNSFKKWPCKFCSYVNKRYLCCGKYVYGNRDESKCQFCGEEKSKSDDMKEDTTKTKTIKWTSDDEKSWQSMISSDNNNKFIDSDLICSKSYRYDEDFVNPSYDLNIPKGNETFKLECISNERFTEKEFELILKKAQSIRQTNKNKFLANISGGINCDISKGDSMGIEHIMAILIYIHFPKYVSNYRVSLPSKYFHFYRFIYEIITYFGDRMPSDMIVYCGLSGGLNVSAEEEEEEEKKEEKKKEEEEENEWNEKRKNDQFEFFNTAFLTLPFSACLNRNVFSDGQLILHLKCQFLNDFNDTKYFNLSEFSSFTEKNGKNEIVFLGEFCELSIENISVCGNKKLDFQPYFEALNLWQKLTSGFADFNQKKYNIKPINESIQKILLQLLKNDKSVPKYIQQLFKYYNETKKGIKYHTMYDEMLDCDFSKICNKVSKELIKPIQELLFNDDGTDVDPVKIKKIFVNAKKYVASDQKEKNF